MNITLDPDVWGPHYWYFLHAITLTYPKYPNAITKKKYYDFVHTIPSFIPVENMASTFSKLLDEYPVTPYLDSRKAFVSWMHFIHNKINKILEKPQYPISQLYSEFSKSKQIKNIQFILWREKICYCIILFLISGIAFYLYNK
jgi:hypothetical protein